MFVLAILSISPFLSAYGQISLSDVLREKLGSGSSVVSNVAKDAVKSELFLIRQQYTLSRNGEEYGSDGKPYFGESYSLGIKVSGGMLLQRCVLFPSAYDTAYDRYKDQYDTKYYYSYQRALTDSVYRRVDFEFGSQFMDVVDGDSLLFRHTDKKSNFGLQIDGRFGARDGIMVWAYASTNVRDSLMSVDLRQTSYRMKEDPDTAVVQLNPNDAGRVIGGVFVVPKYEPQGRVQFLLAGVAVRGENGQWRLASPLERFSKTYSATEARPTELKGVQLTPITKKNKKSK